MVVVATLCFPTDVHKEKLVWSVPELLAKRIAFGANVAHPYGIGRMTSALSIRILSLSGTVDCGHSVTGHAV